LARGHLPSSKQIKKMPWHIWWEMCVVCATRGVARIFFNCSLARFMWSGLCTMFEVSWNPTCLADVFGIFQCFNGKNHRLLWILFAAQSWVLWKTRNKFNLESEFPKQPANLIFKNLLYME
jgi:hypothetical protein